MEETYGSYSGHTATSSHLRDISLWLVAEERLVAEEWLASTPRVIHQGAGSLWKRSKGTVAKEPGQMAVD
ncbi:unnamed protein product [Caretta caretta]